MGSGASTELQREVFLTAAVNSQSQKLDDARAEITRLRRKLHDQTETFGQTLTVAHEHIQEKETQRWASVHDITRSQLSVAHSSATAPVCSLFGDRNPMPNDVVQSSHLGDCYLVAAMSVVAEKPELIRRLFPDISDNSGTLVPNMNVKVLINHQKQWREIILDQDFPVTKTEVNAKAGHHEGDVQDETNTTTDNNNNNIINTNTNININTNNTCLQLLYGQSSRSGTYWVSYLEKAYAKIYGSYAALQGGDIAEALSDLTGFPVVTMKLRQSKQDNDWEMLLQYQQTGQLMACGFICSDEQAAQHEHLYVRANHAYSILDVRNVKYGKMKKLKDVVVVRLRNPWGHLETGSIPTPLHKDIQAALSDSSSSSTSEQDDGTFWLTWKQFASSVNNVYVCLNANVDESSLLERVESVGRWTTKTAGGCSTYPTFRQNPMYTVIAPLNGRLTLALTQPDVRLRRRQEKDVVTVDIHTADDGEEESAFKKLSYNQIGLEVIELDGVQHYRPHHVVVGSYSTVAKSSYWNKRDVTLGPFDVEQGQELIIVPSTYYPGQQSGFLLSAYFEPALQPKKEKNHMSSSIVPCYLKLHDIPKPMEIKKVRVVSLAEVREEKKYEDVSQGCWYSTIIQGKWSKKEKTSGGHGSPTNKCFYQNPQWQIILPDDVEETKVVVFLKNETKSMNVQIPLEKSKRVGMGICMYQNVPCIRSSKEYVRLESQNVIGKVVYSNALEIARSETLHRTVDEPMLIVAACYKAGDEAPFTLQIISDVPIEIRNPPQVADGKSKRGITKNKHDKSSSKPTATMNFGAAKRSMNTQGNLYAGLD